MKGYGNWLLCIATLVFGVTGDAALDDDALLLSKCLPQLEGSLSLSSYTLLRVGVALVAIWDLSSNIKVVIHCELACINASTMPMSTTKSSKLSCIAMLTYNKTHTHTHTPHTHTPEYFYGIITTLYVHLQSQVTILFNQTVTTCSL